jgi:hypothetical protein
MQNCGITLSPISTQEKFPRTENFAKISLLKVENFQLQNFFPMENLCQPITFYKIFFPRKIFLSGNGFWQSWWTGMQNSYPYSNKFLHSSYLYYKWFSKDIVDSGSIINRRIKDVLFINTAFVWILRHWTQWTKYTKVFWYHVNQLTCFEVMEPSVFLSGKTTLATDLEI